MLAKRVDYDYKKDVFLSRKKIDSEICNLESIVDSAIDIFSSIWGGLFRNAQIKKTMLVRCNTCFNRIFFEDVVRTIHTIKDKNSGFEPILQNYFMFLLDYNNDKCVFYSGKSSFFNFAILNKQWFFDKWLDHIKQQQSFYVLIKNVHIDNLLKKTSIVKKKLKTKNIGSNKKSLGGFISKKLLDDNYLMVKTLLTRIDFDVEGLSFVVCSSVDDIKRFVDGEKNVFLRHKLIELYHTSGLTKRLTLLDLAKMNTKKLDSEFGGVSTESLVGVIIKIYAMEYCDSLGISSAFCFHVKRLNRPGNRRHFRVLVLFFLWMLQNCENDIRMVIVNCFNVIIKKWNKPIRDFKTMFLTLDCFYFEWEKSVFLSRSAGSYFIDKESSKTIVNDSGVFVDPRVGRVNLKNVQKFSGFGIGSIKIEQVKRAKKNECIEKNSLLYSKKELSDFMKMSSEKLDNVMDIQSQEVSEDPNIDQARYEQLLKIKESMQKPL